MVRLIVTLDIPGWTEEDVERAKRDVARLRDQGTLSEVFIPQLGQTVEARFESVEAEDVIFAGSGVLG